jgi:protein TonB
MRQSDDDRYATGAMMRQDESIPVPRGWTGRAAWKGAGDSVLLHLLVGAAVVVVLSGPPKSAPQVIDLTLLPPAETDPRPVPPAIVAAAEPSRDTEAAVLPVPPALPDPPDIANPPAPPASSAIADPPDGTAQANPYSPAATMGAPFAGSPLVPAEAPVTTGRGPVTTAAGSSRGTTAGGTPAGDFTWIRDAIQHAIAYPATARKMGWEGKVVVAFHLLPDGSVRDVRVVQGSGYAALDRGAIDAVRNASPFPRSPIEAEVITPVVYRLTAR